jgi:predicted NAD/FAD-dependent oxidoreductase
MPRWHGVTTWWFATPSFDDGRLRLDRDGDQVNTAVAMSASAPSYAPNNRSVIAASSLRDDVSEEGMGRDVARIYGFATSDLEVVAVTPVPHALPHCTRVPEVSFRVSRDIVVAGDHVATPSLQGALASGAAAARYVLTSVLTPERH